MSKYTTLVFKSDTRESLSFVREASQNEHCVAWSMNDEILRLELIEQSLEENDIEKAKSYYTIKAAQMYAEFRVLERSYIPCNALLCVNERRRL